MINVPLDKILFIDIETVGIESDYPTLEKKNPKLAELFSNYESWFKKRFPEDADVTLDQLFQTRTALVPEFAKIICLSVAFVMENGDIKKQSFSNDNERDLLIDCQKLLDRCGRLDFWLCGHNLKNFDIPMLAKRMIINGLMPPPILPSYDTKPWEVKAIDTKDIWQYGGYGQFASLELMCVCLGVESSKTMEVTGNKVHESFWNENKYQEIQDYCEKDVEVLIQFIKKLKELK